MTCAKAKIVAGFIFIMLLASAAEARNDVVLTGSVMSVSAHGSWSDKKFDCTYYEIHVRLQFRNDSDESVIVTRSVPPNIYFMKDYSEISGTSRIEGVRSKNDRYTRPGVKYDPTANLFEAIAQKVPPSGYFIVLPPRGYHEFGEILRVENGFSFRAEPNENPNFRPRIVVIPEFAGFNIEYRFSVAGRPEGVDRVLSAKRNWKKLGKLLIEDDGTYSMKSAFIANINSN